MNITNTLSKNKKVKCSETLFILIIVIRVAEGINSYSATIFIS